MPKSVLHSSIVPLGLSAQALGGAPPAQGSLNFTMQQQLQTQWCWAAVTASAARYFRDRSWTQCRVVNDRLVETMCCSNGDSTTCNRPWYLDRALDRVGILGEFSAGPLTLAEVKAEIDAGRPIGVRIGWRGGGGHFVGISGYSGEGLLDVQDPWFGHSTVDYLAFRKRYQGNGRWTHSYRTKPRG